MESYQWIHPVVGLATLLLLAGTAASKMRATKYFLLHYTLGAATVTAVVLALALAVYTVIRCDCDDDWPAVLFVHLPFALLLTLAVIGQGTMGGVMLVRGRGRRLLRMHRINARVVLGLAIAVLALGVTMLVLLLTD